MEIAMTKYHCMYVKVSLYPAISRESQNTPPCSSSPSAQHYFAEGDDIFREGAAYCIHFYIVLLLQISELFVKLF